MTRPLVAIGLAACAVHGVREDAREPRPLGPEAAAPAPAPAAEAPRPPHAIAYVAPIKSKDGLRSFVNAIGGERAGELAEMEKAAGIQRERMWVQNLRQGSMVIVYRESDAPGAIADKLAKLDTKLAQDFRKWLPGKLESEMVLDGIDEPSAEPTQPYAFAVPLLKGKEAAHKAMCAEAYGPRRLAYLDSRRAKGIFREQIWQQTLPTGTFAIYYVEARDLAAAFTQMSRSADEFDAWYRAGLEAAHGIKMEMDKNTELNETIFPVQGV